MRAFLPTVELFSRGDFNPCHFGQGTHVKHTSKVTHRTHPALSSTANPFLQGDWDHCWRVLLPSGEFCSRRASFSPDSGAFLPTWSLISRGDFNPCHFGQGTHVKHTSKVTHRTHPALSSTANPFLQGDWDHCWRVLFPSGEFCSRRASFSPDSGAFLPR